MKMKPKQTCKVQLYFLYKGDNILQKRNNTKKQGTPETFKRRKLTKYWDILTKDGDCKEFVYDLPIVSHKRNKN